MFQKGMAVLSSMVHAGSGMIAQPSAKIGVGRPAYSMRQLYQFMTLYLLRRIEHVFTLAKGEGNGEG